MQTGSRSSFSRKKPAGRPGSRPGGRFKKTSSSGFSAGGSRNIRKRGNRFLPAVGYKDSEILLKFLTEKGKILPRRITRLSAKDQRTLTNTIKKARHAGILPFQAV